MFTFYFDETYSCKSIECKERSIHRILLPRTRSNKLQAQSAQLSSRLGVAGVWDHRMVSQKSLAYCILYGHRTTNDFQMLLFLIQFYFRVQQVQECYEIDEHLFLWMANWKKMRLKKVLNWAIVLFPHGCNGFSNAMRSTKKSSVTFESPVNW